MKLESRSTEGIDVLHVAGSFDAYHAEAPRQWLGQAINAGSTHIVVDLSAVHFLDSTALSTLVQAMKHAREASGDVYLSGLQQPVRMIFELTRLDKVFEIFVSEEQAIEAFKLKKQAYAG